MSFKVLVVDDSTFFRRRVSEILNQDPLLEVIGEARDGRDAIEKVKALRPDVVTMDVEMPVMDGISSVRQIMRSNPLPILMFSSLTTDGAKSTFDAMEAGALDFLPKNFEDIVSHRKEAAELLQQRVKSIARRKGSIARSASNGIQPSKPPLLAKNSFMSEIRKSESSKQDIASGRLRSSSGKNYKILAVGSSTGGPIALQKILGSLPKNFPCPIIVVQHMPGSFTTAFAERLNNLCEISVKEAEDGDVLMPGKALLAPGGRQMLIRRSNSTSRIVITDAPAASKVTYKPSVDLTFDSVADTYQGDALALILTGMGADGREGCKKMHRKGATIWAQDEQSSVVYGMPQAVTKANITSANYALDDIAENIIVEMR